jgi:hypothetical protein
VIQKLRERLRALLTVILNRHEYPSQLVDGAY